MRNPPDQERSRAFFFHLNKHWRSCAKPASCGPSPAEGRAAVGWCPCECGTSGRGVNSQTTLPLTLAHQELTFSVKSMFLITGQETATWGKGGRRETPDCPKVLSQQAVVEALHQLSEKGNELRFYVNS